MSIKSLFIIYCFTVLHGKHNIRIGKCWSSKSLWHCKSRHWVFSSKFTELHTHTHTHTHTHIQTTQHTSHTFCCLVWGRWSSNRSLYPWWMMSWRYFDSSILNSSSRGHRTSDRRTWCSLRMRWTSHCSRWRAYSYPVNWNIVSEKNK